MSQKSKAARGSLCVRATVAALLAMSVPMSLQAQNFTARELTLEIPAQQLSSAILAFSAQTGVQVITDGTDVAAVATSGVKGYLSIDQALTQLLQGTGLTYRAIGTTAVALTRADSTSKAKADALEEVIVTGSNIKGGAAPGVVNVQTLTVEDIAQTGAAQIADLLKSIPANTGATLYNESGQLTGTAQFQLRGLGFSSTLTLLNGRRAGVSPLSDKSGADFVDINQFPLAMLERVDVLRMAPRRSTAQRPWPASSIS